MATSSTLLSEKHDRLHSGHFQSLATAHIFAHHQVVLANHVRPGAGEPLPVFFGGAGRERGLFPANDPAKLILGLLPARGTVERRGVKFFALRKEISLFHRGWPEKVSWTIAHPWGPLERDGKIVSNPWPVPGRTPLQYTRSSGNEGIFGWPERRVGKGDFDPGAGSERITRLPAAPTFLFDRAADVIDALSRVLLSHSMLRPPMRFAGKKRFDDLYFLCCCEIVPLAIRTFHGPEELQLLVILDSFGNHVDAKILSQR